MIDKPNPYPNGHKYDRADEMALKIDRGSGSDDRIDLRGKLCLARVGTMYCGLPEHGPDIPHQTPPQRELRAPDARALQAQAEAMAKSPESKK